MTIKVVYLELSLNLSTIDVLHKFVSQHGPRDDYTDCGCNFISTRFLLPATSETFCHIKTNDMDNNIIFNSPPPAVPQWTLEEVMQSVTSHN